MSMITIQIELTDDTCEAKFFGGDHVQVVPENALLDVVSRRDLPSLLRETGDRITTWLERQGENIGSVA